MRLLSKRTRLRDVGVLLAGLGILFAGMEGMTGAVKPLAQSPAFSQAIAVLHEPLLGLVGGALLTAVLQSSSASVGILQAISGTGAVTVGMAVPIVMGQNIGTCVTALLSAVGAEKNAKRAALLHFYFNTVGAVILLGVFYLLRFWGVVSAAAAVDAAGVAAIHSLFNVAATLLLLPFSGLLVRLATCTVREKREARRVK